MSVGNSGPETRYGPAGDLWRHTLARIPTLFGRLIYLSSLRSGVDGEYQHPALTQMVGQEQAGDTLRQSHGRLFQDWLCLNLEQQKADLQEYLAEAPHPSALLTDWMGSRAYQNFVPATAQPVEIQLFLSDLETLLPLLKHEHGAASPDPKS